MKNRRELLQSLLGLSAATVVGCDTHALPPQGLLLSTDFRLGHRLRDQADPRSSEVEWRDMSVVIVGGGIAGLSAGWQLHRSGFDDFAILELEKAAGGTSRSGATGAFHYPWGAHYITTPMPENTQLIELLQEMGVVESIAADGAPIIAEQFLCREPEERLFIEGKWIEGLYPSAGATAEDLRQAAAFHAAMEDWAQRRDAQGRRYFLIPIAAASDDPEATAVDSESMRGWMLRQGWDSPRLHWYVDYACRDDYGLTIDRTSAWAGVLYFAARLRQGQSNSQDVITWPEGNGRIVQHLMSRAGDHLHGGQLVARIKPPSDNGEPSATEIICYDQSSGRWIGYRAGRVIFAAPQFIAPYVIDGFVERRGRPIENFRYGSWLVANVHLRDRPQATSFPLCWDNVLYGSKSLGYVVSTHQTGQDYGPTVWTWYYPFSDELPGEVRERMLRLEWHDWAEMVLADLSQPHPDIGGLVTRIDIMRWGHAMIQPYPGFIWSESRRAAAELDKTVHFANTDLSGIALLEEAFHHGVRAADEVLAALRLPTQKKVQSSPRS